MTGEDLLAGSRPRKVRAFDLTFSAPKSVSLLWAFASEPVAEAVAAAHREAVEAALGLLEENAAVARVQSQGSRRRVATQGWVVAGFTRRTSREGDPQLHTHCLVPNLAQRTSDGPARGPGRRPAVRVATPGGTVYQNELQRTLSLRLRGVCWGLVHPQHPGDRRVSPGPSCERSPGAAPRSRRNSRPKAPCMRSSALRMQADDESVPGPPGPGGTTR